MGKVYQVIQNPETQGGSPTVVFPLDPCAFRPIATVSRVS